MYQAFIVVLLLSLLLCFFCISIMAMQKPSNNQKILLIASVCAFISCYGYYCELISSSMDAMLISIKVGYLGKVFAIFLYTTFILNYANIHMPKWFTRFLYAFYVSILLMILTCDRHHLYYSSIGMVQRDGHYVVDLGKGPFYYVFAVSVLLTMLFLLVVSFKKLKAQTGDLRKSYFFIFFSGVMPTFAFLLSVARAFHGYDPTPIGFVLANGILTFTVVRFGLIDTVFMAKELIVEGTTEAVVIYNVEKEILYMNSAAEKLMDEKFRGIDIFDERNHVLEIRDKSYEIRISKVQDAGKMRGYIAWLFDVTEIARKNKELRQLTEQAEKANQAKSTFLSNMSHEIRTPMNAILGFSQLILNFDISPKVREYMDDIVSASHSLLAVINDILDISKIETGKLEIVPTNYYISSVIKDMGTLFSQQAKQKGLAFFMEIDETLPCQMHGDKIRLRGVLINIINNAIKYTQKGEVHFRIKVLEHKDNIVRIQFSIKDTGIGIKKEDQEHLFDAFSQFDKEANYGIEGSGLGLSIAYGVVKLMGGSITVESEYGVGSNFVVEIEQEVVDATPVDMSYVGAEKKETGDRLTFPGLKVLTVDDNEINLRVVSGILQSYEIQVEPVSSGKDAIEACAKTQYDIILMDQMMPELNGTETMKIIREKYENYRSCPIVALTADAMSGARDRLLQEGFDEYLCKPLSTKSLERVLSEEFPDRIVKKESMALKPGKKEEKVFSDEFREQIQVEKGIENCGGAMSEYLEILKITLEYGNLRIKELLSFKEKGDYENYTIKVHSLKSTAANIGAMEVSAMALEQEMAGKEGRYEVIDEKMDTLLEAYRNILTLIKEVLIKQGLIEEKEEPEEEGIEENQEYDVSDEYFASILEGFLQLIDEFEFDRIETLLDSLKTYRMKKEHMEVVEELSGYMMELQVDEMKELIQRYQSETAE